MSLPLLVACGGSSGSGSNPPADSTLRSAQVAPFVVQGLRYSGASHSGLSDAAGHFEYRAGEPVRFSLGSLEFGQFEVDTAFSLINALAGALPATQEAVMAELASLLDVSDLDRVINVFTLLLALDADADPSDGIDLGTLDAEISGITIDVEQPMHRFLRDPQVHELIAGHGQRIDLNYREAMLTLYRLIGLEVPAQRVFEISETRAGVLQAVTSLSYDSDNRLREYFVNEHGDEVIEERWTIERVAGSALIEREYMTAFPFQSSNPPVTWDSVRTYENGLLNQLTEISASGTLCYDFEWTSHRQLAQTSERNSTCSSPGTGSLKDVLWSYDNRLQLQEQASLVGTALPQLQRWQYNSSGLVTRYLEDANFDPAPGAINVNEYSEHYDYTDDQLVLLQQDLNGDSVAELELHLAYDTLGKLEQVDIRAAGSGQLLARYSDTFNSFGLVVTSSVDADGDGQEEYRAEIGRAANGLIESITEYEYSEGALTSTRQTMVSQLSTTVADGLHLILAPEFSFAFDSVIQTHLYGQVETRPTYPGLYQWFDRSQH
jgi:hypothetical protein